MLPGGRQLLFLALVLLREHQNPRFLRGDGWLTRVAGENGLGPILGEVDRQALAWLCRQHQPLKLGNARAKGVGVGAQSTTLVGVLRRSRRCLRRVPLARLPMLPPGCPQLAFERCDLVFKHSGLALGLAHGCRVCPFERTEIAAHLVYVFCVLLAVSRGFSLLALDLRLALGYQLLVLRDLQQMLLLQCVKCGRVRRAQLREGRGVLCLCDGTTGLVRALLLLHRRPHLRRLRLFPLQRFLPPGAVSQNASVTRTPRSEQGARSIPACIPEVFGFALEARARALRVPTLLDPVPAGPFR
eukprot:m.464421 g.464421  ORF g.464421 m.464421 type:complete len:300 (-) comp21618_c0_seq8:655-1554(-)